VASSGHRSFLRPVPLSRRPRAVALLYRIAFGAAAVVVADLIVGLAVFSTAVLAILCYFSFSWVQLAAAYAAVGGTFGTAEQARQAAGVLAVAPALMAIVVYLGIRAIRLPRALWSRSGPTALPGVGSGSSHPARWTLGLRLVRSGQHVPEKSYRRGGDSGEYRYYSLLVSHRP